MNNSIPSRTDISGSFFYRCLRDFQETLYPITDLQ
jgi:hypothetical protein